MTISLAAPEVLPPSFETSRLDARLPVPADAATLFATYTTDPRVSRYMIWRPHTQLAETEAFIQSCLAAVEAGTRFPYILSERESGQLIGMLEARPSGHLVDLGYVLAPRFWGRGYMPEAVAGLAEIAIALPGVFRVQAFCDVENIPSQRTLEKAGFVREGTHARFAIHPNLSPEPRPCHMYAKCN